MIARVKGSPQHQLVIKAHRPDRFVRWLVAVLVVLLVVACLSFTFGRIYQKAPNNPDQQARPLREAMDREIGLRQQRMVEKLAIENARQRIGELEEEIRQLNKGIAFYRGIMAPETLVTGLQVQNLNIEPLEAVNNYRVRWVLVQVGNNEQLVQGDVKLRISGAIESIDHDGVTDIAEEVVTKKFKFRYFQDFVADIVLPDGFQPAQIDALASSGGKNAQKTSRKFDWLIEGSLADVAQ